MHRRRFLSLIGAAGAAPLLPATAAAQGSGALYSRTLYSRALMHAQLRQHVSARGIAYRLKVSLPQAEAMMSEMAAKGLVRPVLNGAGVHVRAVSSIVKPMAFGAGSGSRQPGKKTMHQVRQTADGPSQPSPLMAHLHQLCRDYGLPLSPRANLPDAVLA